MKRASNSSAPTAADIPTFASLHLAAAGSNSLAPNRKRSLSISHGVNAMRAADRSFIVVTHYQRLLNYIVPDFVHVLVDGRIVRSGGKELALELEAKGYVGAEKNARQNQPA